MKTLCVLGKYNYGDPRLGIGTEYEAFTSALRNLGHEVVHFESWDRNVTADLAAFNRDLLRTVAEMRPNFVLTVQRDYEIWIETLQAIRSLTRAITITWTTDDSFKFKKVSKFIAPHYDLITTTYDYRLNSYRNAGLKNVVLTQWAANSEWLHPPLPAAECRFGVTFVGAAYGNREKTVRELQSRGVEVECFGRGWRNGPVSIAEFRRILRESFISLNFAEGFQGSGMAKTQIKARTFEVPGAGGFLLSEYSPGLEKYYRPGQEIVTFRNIQELEAKIRHFQRFPEQRDQIADAGFVRTHAEHTYERRLELILSAAEKLVEQERPVGPVDIDEAIRRHVRTDPFLEALKWLLTKGGTAVCGKERGLKAARRAVFEASWRILGETTFSASGLPGRLFPGV